MLKPWEVVAELEATNSRLDKEAIIQRESAAGNDELFLGFVLSRRHIEEQQLLHGEGHQLPAEETATKL